MGDECFYRGDLYDIIWKSLLEEWKKERKKIAYIKNLHVSDFNLGMREKRTERVHILDFDGEFLDEVESKNYERFPCFFFKPGLFLACLIGKKYFNRTDFLFSLEKSGAINFIKDSFFLTDDNKSYSSKGLGNLIAPIIHREMRRLTK